MYTHAVKSPNPTIRASHTDNFVLGLMTATCVTYFKCASGLNKNAALTIIVQN